MPSTNGGKRIGVIRKLNGINKARLSEVSTDEWLDMINDYQEEKTTICIRIDLSVKKRLIELSDDKVCHISDVVREAINEYLS